MRTLTFVLTTEDVGGTQEVVISLGQSEVARFRPGTRYEDVAYTLAEATLATALSRLLADVWARQARADDPA